MMFTRSSSSLAIKWAFKSLLVTNVSLGIWRRSMITVNDSEVLDNFIENLMSKKMKKWKSKNEINHMSEMERSISDDVSVAETSSQSIDHQILKYITSPRIDAVLDSCLKKDLKPSPETLLKVAYAFAKSGNKMGFEKIDALSSDEQYCDERTKEELKIFQAEASWRSGESIQNSLNVLHKCYKNHPSLRRFVRLSLRSMIREVIQCRGEASLVQVKNLVLQLAEPPYEDAVPLSFLWGRCILSEWFADHNMSMQLVTLNKDNPNFRKAMLNRLNAVVGEALLGHQVEAVYRVLEVLLNLSMHKPAEAVLGKLFDYKYVNGDKRGCEAIINLCSVTDLDIGSNRIRKFENETGRWIKRKGTFADTSPDKSQDSTKIEPVPKFIFKL